MQKIINLCYNVSVIVIHRSRGGADMAKVCEICGKNKKSGNSVTFSHRNIKRTWSPNLRRVRALVDGQPKRINVCTRCLRSGKVERPAN